MNRNSARGRLRALLSALALGLALAAASAPAFAAEKLSGVVNVNTASAEQLSLLPGIGDARARGRSSPCARSRAASSVSRICSP